MEKDMYSFNNTALPSSSSLDDEEHISWPPSPTDKALSRQKSAPYIDYEGLVDFITNRYVTTSSKINSARSPSPEISMTSFSPSRTGSGSYCDTGQGILANLQPETLNFRITDSVKPTLDLDCAEHKANRTLEVLSMQTEEIVAHTENIDIIKSSSSTSTDSFFGCEELKFPHDRESDLSSRSIFAHAEPASPKNAIEILNIDEQVNQEGRKPRKKSKKKKNKETETVAANSQTGKKTNEEQQHAEMKWGSAKRSKITVKTEDLKDRKSHKTSTNAEIKDVVRVQSVHDRTGKGLMSHNDCPKTLTVRAQSAVRQSYLGKDQNRNIGHNRENFGNEAKQDFRNATILSTLNAVQQSRNAGKKKSYSENAHRQKVASGPKELVLCKDTFTLPQIVRETTEPLKNQSRRAKGTTKGTQQTKNPSSHSLCLPPIEKNNFVIAKNPVGINSREISHTVAAQSVLPKKKSEKLNRQLENHHWGLSASNKTDSSRLKSSGRRKSRYDRDVLENRVKVPPFDTRCDVETKIRFPQI